MGQIPYMRIGAGWGQYTGLVGELHRQLCPTLGHLTSCLCKSPIIPYLPRTGGGVGRDIDRRITGNRRDHCRRTSRGRPQRTRRTRRPRQLLSEIALLSTSAALLKTGRQRLVLDSRRPYLLHRRS